MLQCRKVLDLRVALGRVREGDDRLVRKGMVRLVLFAI